MKLKHTKDLLVLITCALLTACGGGTGSSSGEYVAGTQNTQPASEFIQITGAGIKGPLAFADTKLYKLDTSFPDFYDKSSPIATAMTNESAQIAGLSVPRSINPPYILTIGGDHAIDLNTGQAPVISMLTTVITAKMLADKQPVYTTPLTTMVFHMARREAGPASNGSTFTKHLVTKADQVSTLFAIDQNVEIDIFRSPVVINEYTDTLDAQTEAVHHRAALEAFCSKDAFSGYTVR